MKKVKTDIRRSKTKTKINEILIKLNIKMDGKNEKI